MGRNQNKKIGFCECQRHEQKYQKVHSVSNVYLMDKDLLSYEEYITLFFSRILFIYSSEYYLGKTLPKVATIIVYLLGYFSLTQETSGNHWRPFFKRGRCRIDAILDFKDKPTFPRRCWSLSGKAAGSPSERKPLLSKLVSIHPFKEISLRIKSLKLMSKEMEVSLLFTAFQEWLEEQAGCLAGLWYFFFGFLHS